ncbi:acetylgalactosaminyl-O-glycosyl-glycoprotein beta-1,3-N-acetylglucosaminyltransferase-like [Spea bombifrons]|uniref:acetylgalactosaminyl-O-glycosyl-glycoprotein beta-1,3-N-acetylglucosaminyltransferase-like n=1 Tax=Spea bombifrons TaxID=233779 RepID=UPI00234BDA57|nr:acetylgalactosaminyl-O-glycosyl-glycoprotein beta-1,3-N-acetylglucosaminyltransferase-like [Spea bombifrons]
MAPTSTPLPSIRQSATLTDGVYTYHLDLSRFQSEFPYLQNYECSLNLTPRGQLEDKTGQPLLILAIKSHPSSGDRREALRRTWAREGVVGGYRVRPIFLMGQGGTPGHMELVKVESREFGDILQWDINEGHHNLSLKERCFLEWLHHHVPWAAFIFKGDDDVYVNPFSIVRYIEEHGSSASVLHGALQRHSTVMRSSKYQVSYNLFQSHKYPFFLSGGGFLFPGPAAKRLYEVSLKMPVFPLDDVYMGFLVLAANLTFRHDERFHVFGLAYNACLYQRAFVVHGVSPERLLEIWSEVQGSQCNNSAHGLR